MFHGRGQICVHTGHQTYDIQKTSVEKAYSIIDAKLKEGQITKEQAIQLKENINVEEICPKYSGILFNPHTKIPLAIKNNYLKSCEKSYENKFGFSFNSEDFRTNDKLIMAIFNNLIERNRQIRLNPDLKHKELSYEEIYTFFLKVKAPKRFLNGMCKYIRSRSNNDAQHKKNAPSAPS